MKFQFSRSRPKLREWFLVFSVPVPNTRIAFLVFPFPSLNTKKVIPSHAWALTEFVRKTSCWLVCPLNEVCVTGSQWIWNCSLWNSGVWCSAVKSSTVLGTLFSYLATVLLLYFREKVDLYCFQLHWYSSSCRWFLKSKSKLVFTAHCNNHQYNEVTCF